MGPLDCAAITLTLLAFVLIYKPMRNCLGCGSTTNGDKVTALVLSGTTVLTVEDDGTTIWGN